MWQPLELPITTQIELSSIFAVAFLKESKEDKNLHTKEEEEPLIFLPEALEPNLELYLVTLNLLKSEIS